MATHLKHPEADQILARFKCERIENFYHFTSVENLPIISKHGALYSKQLLDSHGDWPCPNPGGNELSHSLDLTNDNWNKVALNLTPHTPMAYHKKNESHLCFFVIATEVAGWEKTVFTNTNAASNDHQRGEGLSGLALINFEMVRCIMPWSQDWVKMVQAEVLIPDFIPIEFMSEVAFISEASKNEGERLWGKFPHPNFVVNKKIFHNTPSSLDSLCGLPYVSHVLLTNTVIDKKNVNSITSHCTCFRRQNTSTISVVI